MGVSVSLSDDDDDGVLDGLVAAGTAPSCPAALHSAVRLLREDLLAADYVEAFAQPDDPVWDALVDEGLEA